MNDEQFAQMQQMLLGIGLILLGIAFSVSVSFVPFVPLGGLGFSVGGLWLIARNVRKRK
jgi:uncharacterized membrane protein YgdD (TMEM256/DUF423 family)